MNFFNIINKFEIIISYIMNLFTNLHNPIPIYISNFYKCVCIYIHTHMHNILIYILIKPYNLKFVHEHIIIVEFGSIAK